MRYRVIAHHGFRPFRICPTSSVGDPSVENAYLPSDPRKPHKCLVLMYARIYRISKRLTKMYARLERYEQGEMAACQNLLTFILLLFANSFCQSIRF